MEARFPVVDPPLLRPSVAPQWPPGGLRLIIVGRSQLYLVCVWGVSDSDGHNPLGWSLPGGSLYTQVVNKYLKNVLRYCNKDY